MLRFCFLSSFVFKIPFIIFRREVKMSQPIRGQGGHLLFPIGRKNTNLVEDVEILLPVKFYWIPFSNFWAEVENVSANQTPGRPSCSSDQPRKSTNLVEDVEILFSCFLSSFVEFGSLFSEGKSKMFQSIRGQGGHLVIPIGPKNTNLVEDVEILLPVKVFVEFRSAISEQKSKMSQPIRGQGGHLVLAIGPKNTNLVGDFEILLPVNFRWIPFSGFREEIVNVSAN